MTHNDSRRLVASRYSRTSGSCLLWGSYLISAATSRPPSCAHCAIDATRSTTSPPARGRDFFPIAPCESRVPAPSPLTDPLRTKYRVGKRRGDRAREGLMWDYGREALWEVISLQHIGIVAHSVPGSAQSFQAIAQHGERELGGHQHPDVSLDCIAMGRSMSAWEAGDYEAIRAILADSTARVARAGADFFMCPDNTAHLALERPGPDLALPGLHIAEVVARQAATAGHQTVGVLGTRWTMEAELYPRALAAHGLHSQTPHADDRELIQQITFEQLVNGVFTDSARERFVKIITSLVKSGCDAVALVCTEFPLLIPAEVSPLPMMDSTDLLAQAAVNVATGKHQMPTWRGGAPPD